MHKYIFFIIFGIILFIIYNNIDGLTISSKSVGEDCENNTECNTGVGNCRDGDTNKCYCYFNKCKSIEDVEPDLDYNISLHNVCASGENDDIYVNMFANSGSLYTLGRCSRDTNCISPNWLMSATEYTKDIEYQSCRGEGDLNSCQRSHKANRCIQQCKLNPKINNTKDLVNSGFEHLNLIDTTDDIDNDIYTNQIPILLNDHGYQIFNKLNNIKLVDYYFFKFLEKKYNSRCKKIKDNIVYIKSRIFYYIYAEFQVKYRISGEENYLRSRSSSFFNNLILENISDRLPFYKLHIDFTNFKKWRGDNTEIDNNRINNWGELPIDNPNFTGTEFEINYNEMSDFFRTNNNITNINIWIKLDGSEHYNSLGLIDIVDDNKLNNDNFNLYKNRILNDLSSDNNNIKDTRVNQFAYKSGTFININNYNRERDDYNINPNKLYLYDMNNGDALVFNTVETPHTSIELQPNEWRITNESRYSYTSKAFNIIEVFDENEDSITNNDSINNSKLSIDDDLLRGMFSIDIIKTFFIEQYNKLKPLYETAHTELFDVSTSIVPFSIEIFKNIMDNIRFEIIQLYSEDEEEIEKNNRLIIDNIKTLIT